MSSRRIYAILLQEWFITRKSLEILIDLFFFSSMSILVFGFVSRFLTAESNPQAGQYLLLGMLLWEIIRITQYSISISALWNIWAKNLSNLFIAPLSIAEYLVAHTLAAVLKALAVFLVASAIAWLAFGFNIFQIGGLNLVFSFLNLSMFAWSVGLVLLGMIFRYGMRIVGLAWSSILIFQPLTAAFFPVSILPLPLQYMAHVFPATYVFEAARVGLMSPTVQWEGQGIALGLNILYAVGAVYIFLALFARSQRSGQFARNE